jgi:hypothetical protein
MSNALAVPAVTAGLTSLVRAAVTSIGVTPGPKVAPGQLDDTGDTQVIVHLYRVSRNAALAALDLPTRSSTGELRHRTQVAIDLHYLLSFRGRSVWETQQLLARTAIALAAEPVLSKARLILAESEHSEIAGNDLARAGEPVRITPDTPSLDELTRLWALYSPGSFTVTLAVVAGPVVLDADAEPGVSLPVRRVLAGVQPLDPIRLDAVGGPEGPGAPIRAAAPMPDLQLSGAGLGDRAGQTVQVRIDDKPVPFTPVDDTLLTITTPAVQPGRHRIAVHRTAPPIDPALSATESRVTSEEVTVLVVPTLGAVTPTVSPVINHPTLRTGSIKAVVTPGVLKGQRVRLLLDGRDLAEPAPVILTADLSGAAVPVDAVDFVVKEVRAGDYRATLEVDAVRSLPELDGSGRFVVTVVTL